MNKQVIASLAKQGDNGRAVRQIDHFVYPVQRSSVSRRGMKAWLEGEGYKTQNIDQGGILFWHQMAPATSAFDALTESLAQTMRANGWEYDGWGTLAVTN